MHTKEALENLLMKSQQHQFLRRERAFIITTLRDTHNLTFEVIGIRLGISGRSAREYYTSYKKYWKEKNDATPVEVSGT